jgi:hypothetical protein
MIDDACAHAGACKRPRKGKTHESMIPRANFAVQALGQGGLQHNDDRNTSESIDAGIQPIQADADLRVKASPRFL